MAHVVLQLRHRHASQLRGGLVLIHHHVCRVHTHSRGKRGGGTQVSNSTWCRSGLFLICWFLGEVTSGAVIPRCVCCANTRPKLLLRSCRRQPLEARHPALHTHTPTCAADGAVKVCKVQAQLAATHLQVQVGKLHLKTQRKSSKGKGHDQHDAGSTSDQNMRGVSLAALVQAALLPSKQSESLHSSAAYANTACQPYNQCVVGYTHLLIEHHF